MRTGRTLTGSANRFDDLVRQTIEPSFRAVKVFLVSEYVI